MARTSPSTRRASAARPADPATSAEARADRLEALHQQLTQGVAAIRDGASWQAWLDVAARFHHYSFGNQVLIAAQDPNATLVAGYRTWQGMGRHVRKGEKALWVLAPITPRRGRADVTNIEDLAEPETAAGPQDQGSPRADWSQARVVGFRGAPVFDVAQTEGEPLPTPPRAELLAGQAPPGLWDALAAAVGARGFTLARCPDGAAIGGANGITDFGTRTVTIRADVDDAQAVKTLAHEAGHALLHDPGDSAGAPPVCRGILEVEAESVAYLVTAHHGLDASGYTFAYIAGWAGRDADAVTRTATRVLATARTLIQATDPATSPDQAAATQLADAARTGAQAAVAAADAAAGTRDRLAAAVDPAADRLRVVLADAQAWFLAQAVTSPGYATAVTDRGYPVPVALGYGVGWAPVSWTGLVDHLRSRGHTSEDLLAAGVAGTTRTGRLIDRFRGRVTFPVHDPVGVVGFTARDTTGHPDAPKYLNTPTTTLYDKGRVLFGTHHLPDPGAGHPVTVVLTEGPWDALAVTHTGGGDTVGVAACGTAVTDHHLDLTHGPGRTLVLAPDADPAGTTALGRVLGMLTQRGAAHPAAVRTSPGTDLADVHATTGTAGVTAVLADARPAGVVYAEAHLADHPPADSPEARVAAARAAAAHTSGLTLGQRANLGAVLIHQAGISPQAALALITPPVVAPPRPVAAAAPAAPGPAAARTGPRR